MKKSLGWSTAVLGVLLLFSAASLSAQSKKSTDQTQFRPAANVIAIPSALPARILAIADYSVYLMDRDDSRKMDRDDWHKKDRDWNKWDDNDGDGDGDKDDHKYKKYHNDPTPEPSTLLSFGAAILIGSAVVYSRRLRKSK